MDRSAAVPDRTPPRPGMRAQSHRLGPLVVLGVGVAALFGAVGLSLGELTAPGPGLWPFVVAALLTGSALILVAVDDREDYERWTRGSARIAGGVAGLAVFVVAFEAVGFLLPAFLMLLLWLRIFGREPWRWSLGLALAGSVGFYLLFDQVLGVPFPDDVVAGLVGA
jgi:putative tricarboxylic transport membrane protein